MTLPKMTTARLQAHTARGQRFIICGPRDTPTHRWVHPRRSTRLVQDVTHQPAQHRRALFRNMFAQPGLYEPPIEQKRHAPVPALPRRTIYRAQ